MKSPTSTSTRSTRTIPAPETRTTEQWAVVFDGRIDLAITFESEDAVDTYIDMGVAYGNDRSRYGKVVRHRVVTHTPWRGVR